MSEKIPKTINVFGHEIHVGSDEQCDSCEWWICARVRLGEKPLFGSAQESFCTQCGHAVWYDARGGMSKPKKICIECAMTVLPAAKEDAR